MKFKSIASPAPSQGLVITGKKLVVPDQTLSLQEIIERFTRGEALPIARAPVFDEDGEDDLEKVSHMDLVDKQEFVDSLKKTQLDFEKQEKKKARKERERLDKLAVEKLAADKLAAEKSKVIP
ncbi:hypothetical protein [Blackfly microvirus SF02]|uniref:Uncharacterized protein n=1 Tax=Blackfly microvirus SF02 TaxID=2576452 RepID=A0A4P8PQ93_9VIRU|nr:hypothetical protein [Blackfly microvirus SF02]